MFLIGISGSYASDLSSSNSDTNENTNVEMIKNDVSAINSVSNDNVNTNSNRKINTISTSKNNTQYKSNKKDNVAAGESKKLIQSQIFAVSRTIDNYIKKNNKLPNYVTIDGYKFSMPEYMYILSKAVYYNYNKKITAITIKYNINNPCKPTGVNIKGKLTKTEYYSYAKYIIKYMDKYNKAPDSIKTKIWNMQYQTAIYMLNTIIYTTSKKNGVMPAEVDINVAKKHSLNKILPKYTRNYLSVSNTEISLDNIKKAASRVNAYVNQKDTLPNYVEINEKKYTMTQFLYLLSITITRTNNGSTSGINLITVNNPNNPTGNSIKGKLTKSEYLSLANNITNFIKTTNQAPNYARSPLGNIQFQTLVFEFSKIVEYAYKNEKLPSSVTINVKSTDPINFGGADGGRGSQTTVLNDKYNGESLTQYLKATKNCQVNNSIIKTLAASITKNYNNDQEKATAIYNWTQKNVDYSFYYDTKKGGVGTYNVKSGNCVDQAHLSIAIYRTAGLAARYVHGTCTFSNGNVYGHVWVQVLIEDTWIVSDTTSSRNSLGVVNNWNPNTYTLKTGKVAEISF